MSYLTKYYLIGKSIPNITRYDKSLVRHFEVVGPLNRKGGIPGCNLPFRKCMDNPMRFTAFYLLAGVIGFGAPWLVVMHQMLRPYDYVVD